MYIKLIAKPPRLKRKEAGYGDCLKLRPSIRLGVQRKKGRGQAFRPLPERNARERKIVAPREAQV
jgi:hypothetical protein